jgi:hypothetical protein
LRDPLSAALGTIALSPDRPRGTDTAESSSYRHVYLSRVSIGSSRAPETRTIPRVPCTVYRLPCTCILSVRLWSSEAIRITDRYPIRKDTGDPQPHSKLGNPATPGLSAITSQSSARVERGKTFSKNSADSPITLRPSPQNRPDVGRGLGIRV